MDQPRLAAEKIGPTARDVVSSFHRPIVDKVAATVAGDPVVIVGMAQNPSCKKARRLLDGAGVPYQYLEYGSYFSLWRKRNALKMWTGWPSFPMVFVNGVLVGGAQDLKKLLEAGELKR